MALLLVAGAVGEARAEGLPSLAGKSLKAALAVLEGRGLRLVYTDELVKPEMRVEGEPTKADPREVLQEILAPHGLGILEGPGETLVVVATAPPAAVPVAAATLRGEVWDRSAGLPVAEAEVFLEPGGRQARTGRQGRFAFDGLAPGSYRLTVSPDGEEIGGFLPQSLDVDLEAGAKLSLVVAVTGVPVEQGEIVVLSRPGKVPGDELAVVALDREDVASVPSLGGDAFRSLSLLPGATSAEQSAKPLIRGGRDDEVLVQLDGLEILEAYHLKDFGSALSILPGAAVGEIRLLSGGFPAEYGERMSGVLDFSSVTPPVRPRTSLSLGVFQASVSHGRDFFAGKGRGFGILRYGYLQLPLQVADQPEDPLFWDAFARIDHTRAAGRSLRGNLLASGDRLSYEAEEGGEREAFFTKYENHYLWLTDDRVAGPRLLLENRISLSQVQNYRDVDAELVGGSFAVTDRRRLETPALGHEGYFDASDLHHLKWGLDLRYLDVDYGYRNERSLVSPLAALRALTAVGTTAFDQGFHGFQVGSYFADRLTWSRLSLEAGVRFDENSVTDDEYLSPRLDLGWRLGKGSRLRLAWGYFYQSQRLYELEVADGSEEFQPAERAEHRIASFQHRFEGLSAGPLVLRLELYERRVSNPRRRFENLADPVSKVPELEPDRILLVPDSSVARGAELFLSGSLGSFDWFSSYTYSRSRDTIDGRSVRRPNDQPHAASLDLRYRLGSAWDFNLALQAHSGWPTTRLGAKTAVAQDGTLTAEPVLVSLYGERLRDYRRADLQVRRRWQPRRGELELAVNLINLTNRRNARGFEFDFEIRDGQAVVERDEQVWQGLLPSLDLIWRF